MLVATRGVVRLGGARPRDAAYETALTYALQREQFGKPLASFQIVQDRLVKMLAEVTAMQLYCMQLARLEAAGGCRTRSPASRSSTTRARRAG